MERICEQRLFDGKQALAIQWGAIADVGMIVDSVLGGSNETAVGGTMPQRIQSCLRTLELILIKSQTPSTTPSSVWSTFVPCERREQQQNESQSQKYQKSIVETIVNIMGLKSVWCNESVTLGELGLDSLMSVEIKQILEQTFNVSLSLREIQQLTLEKIKAIEQQQCQQQQSQQQQSQQLQLQSEVLKTFSRMLSDKDINDPMRNNQQKYEQLQKQQQYEQLVKVEESMFKSRQIQKLMPTRCIEKLNNVEYVPYQDLPVFAIHSIEGHTNMLKPWAQHMKYPVYGCQFTEECTRMETIEQLADFYWQQIDRELSRCGTTQMIHLCGYSFGGSVAFEMAAKRPYRIASITFLDGSHSYVNTQISNYCNQFQLDNVHETECEALFTFMQQYTRVHTRESIIRQLRELPTLELKVMFVCRELLSKSQFNFECEDLEQAAYAYVTKLTMASKYQPKSSLRMRDCLLVKASQVSDLNKLTLGEDFGLKKVVSGMIKIESVKGDHQTFLQNESAQRVAQLMTEYFQGF
jgi:fatty acid synthase, animal type